MRFRHGLTLALVMALAGSMTAPLVRAGGEKGKTVDKKVDKSNAPASEILTIRLKNADAAETATVLLQIFDGQWPDLPPVRFVPEKQTNSLHIRGTMSQLREIRNMIDRLDGVPVGEDPPEKLSVFSLGSLEPGDALEKSLRLAFGSKAGNFAIDPTRKMVIVSAEPATMERVSALLERLMVAESGRADDVQVRILWLVSDADAKNAPEMSADIKEMLPGLAKLGVPRAQIAAQFVINTQPDARFQAKGSTLVETVPYQLSAEGRLTTGKGTNRLEIHIQATRATAQVKKEVCDLQTQINAPMGHLVALGVTPSENLSSAFIVQILPSESRKTGTKK